MAAIWLPKLTYAHAACKRERERKGKKSVVLTCLALIMEKKKIFLENARRLPLASHYPVLGHMPTHRPITADQSLAKRKRSAMTDLGQL